MKKESNSIFTFIIVYFLLIVIFSASIVLFINIHRKVSLNSKLILGRNFYVKIEYGYDTNGESEIEVILKGKPYEVKSDNDTENIDEYGCVGKLYRYKDYWVGKISSDKGDSCRTFYFAQWYYHIIDNRNLRTKITETQDKYSGYFIINENIEKTGLSEKELLKYLKIEKIKELKFKKAEYYIEKYGNEIILAPYYDTKNEFNSSKWGKEKTIEQFEEERKSNIVTCIFIIIIGIIGVIVVIGIIYFRKNNNKLNLR